MIRMLLSALMMVAVVACQSGHPVPDRLSEEKFARLYADLWEQAHRNRQHGLDSLHALQAADSLLLREGVTVEEYRTTVQWYNADVTRWRKLVEDVKLILQDRSTPHPSPG